MAFNAILQELTEKYNREDPDHYYFYTDVVFLSRFEEIHISDIDCFHPSAIGQKELSEVTWNAGPFGAYQY